MTETSPATTPEPLVLTRVVGRLGHITLNKPRAINALNEEMVVAIDAALRTWAHDDSVAAVLMTGAGERGLCAGGDIKAIHAALASGTYDEVAFWAEEYTMNHRIASYPKPYVAVMDGITMGGGVGVSGHGSLRIVTETTRIAMPETGIGLFPDVGATHLLARLPHALGMYMGLTGLPLGPGAAQAHGLAEHFVPRADLPDFLAALEEDAEHAAEVAARFASPAPLDEMAEDLAWIEECFTRGSVAEVVAALDAHADPRARDCAEHLRTRSPLSLELTFRLVSTAGGMSLTDVLERDYRAATGMGEHPDLREGIRAAVIDKDRNPVWNPATLDAIDPAVIDAIVSTPIDRKLFA